MPELYLSGDGSPTLYHTELDEYYHSKQGAWTESMHVFIQHGLLQYMTEHPHIRLLEVGFGAGLNALLTLIHQPLDMVIEYHALEPHPLSQQITDHLFYSEAPEPEILQTLHDCPWESPTFIHPRFSLLKREKRLQDWADPRTFDLIYYDAFSPTRQPELWTIDVLRPLYNALVEGGMLLTYCAQGNFKRTLSECGFLVETLPGPPWKREMTRAIKVSL